MRNKSGSVAAQPIQWHDVLERPWGANACHHCSWLDFSQIFQPLDGSKHILMICLPGNFSFDHKWADVTDFSELRNESADINIAGAERSLLAELLFLSGPRAIFAVDSDDPVPQRFQGLYGIARTIQNHVRRVKIDS